MTVSERSSHSHPRNLKARVIASCTISSAVAVASKQGNEEEMMMMRWDEDERMEVENETKRRQTEGLCGGSGSDAIRATCDRLDTKNVGEFGKGLLEVIILFKILQDC